MARRPRVFAPGLLYHVMVRGNQRRKTFLNDSDYQAYLQRLARYRKRYGYRVHGEPATLGTLLGRLRQGSIERRRFGETSSG